jgi:anti-anti-sigma factor
VRVVVVSGRVDQAHAKLLESELAPHLSQCTADGQPLVLDFSGVDYVSSVGLRVLLLAAKQAKTQNGRVAIAALTPMVAEVFKVSRFDLVLSVHATVDAAVAALAA